MLRCAEVSYGFFFLLFAGGQERVCVRQPTVEERVVVRDQQRDTGPEEEDLPPSQPDSYDA